jgi:hypothetical protein
VLKQFTSGIFRLRSYRIVTFPDHFLTSGGLNDTLGAGTSNPANLRNARTAVSEAVTTPPPEIRSGDPGIRHIRSTKSGETERAAAEASSEAAAGRPRRTSTVRRCQASSISTD